MSVLLLLLLLLSLVLFSLLVLSLLFALVVFSWLLLSFTEFLNKRNGFLKLFVLLLELFVCLDSPKGVIIV